MPLIHPNNPVCFPDRIQAVCRHDYGRTGDQDINGLLNLFITLCIQHTDRLIQKDKLFIPQKHPGNGNTLLSTRRFPSPSRIMLFRPSRGDCTRSSSPTRGMISSSCSVDTYGTPKTRLSQSVPEKRMKSGRQRTHDGGNPFIHFGKRDSVNEDLTFHGRIKPKDQIEQCTFSGSGYTDKSNHLACPDMDIYICPFFGTDIFPCTHWQINTDVSNPLLPGDCRSFQRQMRTDINYNQSPSVLQVRIETSASSLTQFSHRLLYRVFCLF